MAAIVNSMIVQFMYNMLEGEHHVSEVRSKPILDGTWLSDITNVLSDQGVSACRMAAIVNSMIVQYMYNMSEGKHHVSEVRSKAILDGTWLSDITNVLA
uniref:AlNc14C3G509 protein n=1 Tax=Albugo laibachii Nc14 TaxID=890382 RepID=F0W040_9STRA|nr:AlNc14C3G509 [Albugo laibachii Nc14]|eukprot:CCA14411.1 AlNc14C3G509 [Albugo laibachii Nc14]